MGLLARLFRVVPKEKWDGIRLDTDGPYWEVDGPKTFKELFNALQNWVPAGAILYFEGGYPDKEINNFMTTYSIPEPVHIAIGTIWPCSEIFHVPATTRIIAELAQIMNHHAESELAIHFHIYRNNQVLLEWHDAFSEPLLISGTIPEKQVKIFTDKIGKNFRKVVK